MIRFILISAFMMILWLIIFSNQRKEHYSMGALNQLMAKDVQDTYLTGDAWKYIPPYGCNYPYCNYQYNTYPYTYGPWLIPTRYGKYSYYYNSPYGYYYYH